MLVGAFGVGAAEIVILGLVCLFFVGLLVLGVVALVYLYSQKHQAPRPAVVAVAPASAPAPPASEPITHLDVVASITRRFCPHCRLPLATDAPEGLCPACLLAGGMESALSPELVDGAALTTPPSGSQPPLSGEIGDLQAHFPQLEIQELLGRGGMGAVYKVRQKNLDRIVALKVIPPEAAEDPTFAERFAREARALARLNHPNIVTVHDFGQAGSTYYLVMEYIDGVNLRQTLRAGRLSPPEALAIVPQICDALQYAHDQGVVHRDIKPENVLLDRSGRIKIADFGLAKLIGKGPDDFTLTRTQQVMGTPRYMAPEQIERPTTVDHRADIYSLGVVIYEMLTGELPIGRFAAPSERVQVDVRIDQVVLRALEKEPDRRYQRASQVKTELASASSGVRAVHSAPTAGAAVLPAPTPIPVVTPPIKSFAVDDTGPPSLAAVAAIVVGMAVGLLMVTAGLAGVGGLVVVPNAIRMSTWDWLVGSLAVLAGGLGAGVGSLVSYQQLPGAVSLLHARQTTWLDWLLRGLGCLGLLLILAQIGGWRDDLIIIFGLPGILAVLLAGTGLAVRFVAAQRPEPLSTLLPRPPAGPPVLTAVGIPTLVVAAICLALWLDVSFAQPAHDPEARQALSYAELFFDSWKRVVLLAALILVPGVFAGAAAYRALGPRRIADDGEERVSSPFAARWWLVGIGLLGVTTLFLPWFRLSVQAGAVVVLPLGDLELRSYQDNRGRIDESMILHEGSLRSLTMMPAGWRFSHRGFALPEALGFALLFGLLAAFAAFSVGGPQSWTSGLTIGCGLLGLLCAMSLVHRTADRDPSILVDATTLRGLEKYIRDSKGVEPWSMQRWAKPAATAFDATPTIGMILAFTASGLALIAGVCNFAWGDAATAGQPRVPSEVALSKPGESPTRATLHKRVAGPAMGLMVAGVLGLMPLLLTCIAVSALTLYSDVRARVLLPQSPAVERAAWVPLRATALMMSAALPITSMLPPTLAWQAMPPPPVQEFTAVRWTFMAIPIFLLNLALSAVIFSGGWRMRQLKSHGLASVAAILAILPCTLGWLIGLPMGLWALYILAQPEIREAFET